ncbi:MAG: cysteine hydrolase family protein [Vicinamibacterales bacterium]
MTTPATAVLALHWLQDIVSPAGRLAPTFSGPAEAAGVIPRTAALLDAARRAGLPVLYTRVCFRPGYPDLLGNGPLMQAVLATGALQEGSEGAAILAELEPSDDDLVISHRRMSGFWGSELETVLRTRRIERLVLTGVATNFTVLNTAFDAFNAGYDVTVVRDCCSAADDAVHAAALHTIEAIGAVTAAAELISSWGTGR